MGMVKLYFIPLSLFIFDRLLKYIAQKTSGFFLIPKILSFNIHRNAGLAFGITIPSWIFWVLSGLVFVILIWRLAESHKNFRASDSNQGIWWRILSLVLILAGAASNLIDKLIFGYTIDYFNFISLSVFNFADAMVLGGIIILFFYKQKMVKA